MADEQTGQTATQNKNGAAGGAGQMPLFYTQPALLDSRKHSGLSLKKDIGFGFTDKVNAVPINVIEFPQIAHFYPIAFSTDGTATPVAILGVRNDENLFVNKDGSWREDTYIPAYIRRYPFIFTEMENGERLSLCIDERDDLFIRDDSNPFFDKEGKPAELCQNAMEFCKSYHAAAQQTLEFSKALAASNLLVDRQAEINVDGNQKISFSGFQIVDEKALNEMNEKMFIEWRNQGWLAALYAHLFSGMHWANLTKLINEKMSAAA
jgi:hypothetical protein